MSAPNSDVGFWGSLSFVQAGLVIFLAVFVLIVLWVLAARRGSFDRVARIPLEDDPVEPRRSHPMFPGSKSTDDSKQP